MMLDSPVMPVDWSSMSAGLVQWISSIVPSPWSVSWAEQKAPIPSRPYVSINMLVPPVPEGQAWTELINRQETAVAIASPALDGVDYSVTINGTTITVNAGVDATDSSLRAAMVAAINASDVDVVATPTSIDGVLSLTFPVGDSQNVETDPEFLLVRAIYRTTTEGEATFQIDCFGRMVDVDSDPSSMFESVPVSTGLIHSLEGADVQATLASAGWSIISVDAIRKQKSVIGTRWDDRSGFDVRLRCSIQREWLSQYFQEAGAAPEGTYA